MRKTNSEKNYLREQKDNKQIDRASIPTAQIYPRRDSVPGHFVIARDGSTIKQPRRQQKRQQNNLNFF